MDTEPATIEVLPAVVDRVAERLPLLFCSGIRLGTDVLKGLAYGASAVLIGRPYIYGLTVAGAHGVRDVVNILRTELEGAIAVPGFLCASGVDANWDQRSLVWHEGRSIVHISKDAEPSSTFREIYVLNHPHGRVVLFKIPAAPRGIPIAWKGHYYARAGKVLCLLDWTSRMRLADKLWGEDWSAQVVSRATLTDLDEAALDKARESFAQKYANRFSADEVKNWPLTTFLDHCRLLQNRQTITGHGCIGR